MIKLKDLGNFESVKPIVIDIINGNIPALEIHLSGGWDIDEVINGAEYLNELPITLALVAENFDSIKWLVEHGANLEDKNTPAFLAAVRYCDKDIIRYITDKGANIHALNNVKSDAFTQAIYGNKPENLPLIHELGHTVPKHGGAAFARAVNPISRKPDYNILDFFIQNGVDVNYKVPGWDNVYSWRPTPLCIAARYGDLELCKYLVAHGADVMLSEKGGTRPYSIAVERGDMEMAEYFKSLEPPEFHNTQNKLAELKSYKLPKALLDFLQGKNLRLDFGECEAVHGCAFVDFFALTDVVPMKAGRQKVLRLSRVVDYYSDLYIVWNPKTKHIAFYDEEHEVFRDIAAFDDFMENAVSYMSRVISGELD